MAEQHFKAHIFCCNNERPAGHPRGCCKEKGADDLRNYLKARAKEAGVEGIRVQATGCLDKCEVGPAIVVYPEGVWYTVGSKEDADEIIDSHLKNGKPVARLMLEKGQKELTDGQKQGRESGGQKQGRN